MKSSTLFERGPLPPMSTSHPPDIIHVIGVPRPSSFFTAPLPCIILNANRRTKNGDEASENGGVAGNEVSKKQCVYIQC